MNLLVTDLALERAADLRREADLHREADRCRRAASRADRARPRLAGRVASAFAAALGHGRPAVGCQA